MTRRRVAPPFNSAAVFSFNGTIRQGIHGRARVDGIAPAPAWRSVRQGIHGRARVDGIAPAPAWRSVRSGVRCGHRHGSEGEAETCLEQRRRAMR